jgi:death-on-curing protein
MPSATEQSIHFLTLEEVLAIHQDQYPDSDPLDHRQLGQLSACLALPATKQGGGYSHRDLFEMAAAYLFHLVHNRPFLKGNRRIAALASLFFLYLHDIELKSAPEDLAVLTQEVARNRATLRTVAQFFKSNALPSI